MKTVTENLFSDASNIDSLSSLRWILSNAVDGFYMFTAPPPIQQKVLRNLSGEDMSIYDYSKTNERSYSYRVINQWATQNTEKRVYAIINMQLALPEERDIQNLNLSRDMISRHNKIWIYGMTEDTRYRIMRHAPDFSSFVRLTVNFIEEDKSVFRDYIPHYSYNDFASAQEAQGFLRAYEAMENKYMSYDMNSDELSREKLLSSALTLENIAKAYLYVANYPKAMSCLKKSLSIREKFLEEDTDTATTYQRIADIYQYQGEYATALSWYQKALVIRERMLGKEHPETATTYSSIAVAYENLCDYTTALSWHQKALDIRERVLGAEHPRTALTYDNIAVVYRYQGNYETALSWHQKARIIRERALGFEHPMTATTYFGIANVYKEQGEFATALSWYQKALAIREHVFGKDHPNTAAIYNSIATVYYHQGDYVKALSLYNKAKAILEKWLGKDHPDIAGINSNIAKVIEIIAENSL